MKDKDIAKARILLRDLDRTSEEIGELLGFAKDGLRKKFKRKTGLTINQFRDEFREQASRNIEAIPWLSKAVKLLNNPLLSLAEIENECGYSDRQAFSLEFKRKTGRSPSSMRRGLWLKQNRSRVTGGAGKVLILERIGKAASLLKYSRKTLEDISVECGYSVYNDCAAIKSSFNKNVGQGPEDFRKKYWRQHGVPEPSWRIAKAIALLETTDLPMYMIAEESGFDYKGGIYKNASHFSVYFKREMGMTPIEYKRQFVEAREKQMLELCIKNAAKVLRENRGIKIFQLANNLGYENPRDFGKDFKGVFGLSPSKYKKTFPRGALECVRL